jgi:hypothetical protein
MLVEAILMLCFFHGRCWPVMATHDLAGRNDGGFQLGDSMDTTEMEDSSRNGVAEVVCRMW